VTPTGHLSEWYTRRQNGVKSDVCHCPVATCIHVFAYFVALFAVTTQLLFLSFDVTLTNGMSAKLRDD